MSFVLFLARSFFRSSCDELTTRKTFSDFTSFQPHSRSCTYFFVYLDSTFLLFPPSHNHHHENTKKCHFMWKFIGWNVWIDQHDCLPVEMQNFHKNWNLKYGRSKNIEIARFRRTRYTKFTVGRRREKLDNELKCPESISSLLLPLTLTNETEKQRKESENTQKFSKRFASRVVHWMSSLDREDDIESSF